MTDETIDEILAEEKRDATIPECLSNPTLGAATNGVFLDVLEAQQAENRAAEIEGREPRIAKRDEHYPAWQRPEDLPSHYSPVVFIEPDSEENVIPDDPDADLFGDPEDGPENEPEGTSEAVDHESGTEAQTGGSGSETATEAPSDPWEDE